MLKFQLIEKGKINFVDANAGVEFFRKGVGCFFYDPSLNGGKVQQTIKAKQQQQQYQDRTGQYVEESFQCVQLFVKLTIQRR